LAAQAKWASVSWPDTTPLLRASPALPSGNPFSATVPAGHPAGRYQTMARESTDNVPLSVF
jgi:hypothetical protein